MAEEPKDFGQISVVVVVTAVEAARDPAFISDGVFLGSDPLQLGQYGCAVRGDVRNALIVDGLGALWPETINKVAVVTHGCSSPATKN